MLINMIIVLLGVGMVSVVIPQDRLFRLWSLVVIAALFYCGYLLYTFNSTVLEIKEIYPWIKAPNIQIDIEILINQYNVYFVNLLILFALIVVANNSFYPAEIDKNRINGIVLLNVFFIIMMISSANYMQFLTAIGAIDVLVFSAINKTEAKKKYIYSNFLADMGILSVCAIVFGNAGEINFSYLEYYVESGQHKDYVAIILLLCVFIKSGLFMFHGPFLEMSGLLFNRINFIIFGTTPLVGFLVLNRFKLLLDISEYSYPILLIFSFASIIWGFYGVVSMDNLKRKSIYFALMFWGLMYLFAALDRNITIVSTILLVIMSYLFNQTLLLVNKASSNEKNVSVMGGFIKELKITWFITLIIIGVYINLLLSVYPESSIAVALYLSLFILGSSYILGQIYLGKSNADERVIAMLKNPSWFLSIPILAAAVLAAYLAFKFSLYFAIIMLVWILLFAFRPFRHLEFLYDKGMIQNLDLINSGYELFIITPVRVLGRILWLAVDFVFIEKTIISSISNIINFFIRIFQRFHKDNFYSYVILTLAGFCAVTLIWWFGGQ